VPFNRRALASSLITLGGRAGGALAPAATAYLVLLFGGWRPVLWYYALLGLAWSVFFWRIFRQTPAQHPACNRAEVDLIEGGLPPEIISPRGDARTIPWKAACGSLSLWMQCVSQFTTNIPWVFLITWLPTYLVEEFGVDEEATGLFASLPLLAGMAGCLLGGMITDRLTRRLGLKWGRNSLGMFTKFVAAAGMVLALAAREPLLATLAFALVSFATDSGLGATWAYFQDAGGPYVGTLLGWANMFGNLGAAVSPLLLGWLASNYDWPTALAACAVIYVFSGLCWLGIDARVPIVPSKPETAPGC
jgi:nitrate/nitrite transporter NarK